MLNAQAFLPALFCALVVGCNAAANEPAFPKIDGSLCAVLPDGAQVELVAVGEVPAGEKTWWQPDGTPLEQPPIQYEAHAEQPQPNCLMRVFLFRTLLADGTMPTSPHPKDPNVHWPINSYSGSGKGSIRGKILEEEQFVAAIPSDARVTFVRDYVDSPWKTVATTDRHGGTTTQISATAHITWDKPLDKGGGSQISAEYAIPEGAARIRAIDYYGQEHAPDRNQVEGDTKSTRTTDHFFGLPLSRVKEFQLQVRTYRLQIEFRNIALHRGQKSPAEVYLNGKPSPSQTTSANGKPK